MHTRNAASVFPEPVGAAISVWLPAAISAPALSLRRGRPGREPPREPGTHRRMERLQHPATVTRATDSNPRHRHPPVLAPRPRRRVLIGVQGTREESPGPQSDPK